MKKNYYMVTINFGTWNGVADIETIMMDERDYRDAKDAGAWQEIVKVEKLVLEK